MISAIILAAGSSVRMGKQNKLLLPFGESTIIENVLAQLMDSKVNEIIIVLGHEKERIRQLFTSKDIIFVYNQKHETGMTSSIQCGLKAVSEVATGYLICLSDMPFLTSEDYNCIVNEASGKKEILLPFYENKKGNPVYFSHHFKEALLLHELPEGCRDVVKQHKDFVKKINFANRHILSDIDTSEDFKRLAT